LQVLYGPLFIKGMGLADGEFVERINSFFSPWGWIVRRMSQGGAC
jgi:hypothetical protein